MDAVNAFGRKGRDERAAHGEGDGGAVRAGHPAPARREGPTTCWSGPGTAWTSASCGWPTASRWRSRPTRSSSCRPTAGSGRRGSRSHILASDAATSGLPLRWMAVDLNLPPEITDEELTSLWDAFHRACEDIGVAVVTGHTARYDGCAWPMVGGAVCMASGPEDRFVTPTMARPGDRVIVTKGAAIEATALFAATFPERLARGRRRRRGRTRRRAVRADDRGARGDRRARVRPPGRGRDLDARRDRGRRARRADRGRLGVGGRHADRARRRSRCARRCAPSASTSGWTRTRRSARAP